MAGFILDASSVSDKPSLESFRNYHQESYSKIVNDSSAALYKVWTEIGVHASDVHSELNKIETNVAHVWHTAIDQAERQRDALHQCIRDVETEMLQIQQQLGNTTENASCSIPLDMTLKERLDRMICLRDQCQKVKEQRITEFTGAIRSAQSLCSRDTFVSLGQISLERLTHFDNSLVKDKKTVLILTIRMCERLVGSFTVDHVFVVSVISQREI